MSKSNAILLLSQVQDATPQISMEDQIKIADSYNTAVAKPSTARINTKYISVVSKSGMLSLMQFLSKVIVSAGGALTMYQLFPNVIAAIGTFVVLFALIDFGVLKNHINTSKKITPRKPQGKLGEKSATILAYPYLGELTDKSRTDIYKIVDQLANSKVIEEKLKHNISILAGDDKKKAEDLLKKQEALFINNKNWLNSIYDAVQEDKKSRDAKELERKKREYYDEAKNSVKEISSRISEN